MGMLLIHVNADIPLGAIILAGVFILAGGWALFGGILSFFPRTPRHIRKINRSLKKKDKADKELIKMYQRRGLLKDPNKKELG